jgi:hypothetical protein
MGDGHFTAVTTTTSMLPQPLVRAGSSHHDRPDHDRFHLYLLPDLTIGLATIPAHPAYAVC